MLCDIDDLSELIGIGPGPGPRLPDPKPAWRGQQISRIHVVTLCDSLILFPGKYLFPGLLGLGNPRTLYAMISSIG